MEQHLIEETKGDSLWLPLINSPTWNIRQISIYSYAKMLRELKPEVDGTQTIKR
jgi:hypothetical protein